MKVAVRYYTKTGNTKRLAEAVAQAVGVEALPISSPVTEQVDVLFLGNSYYAFSIDPEVRSFIRSLDKSMIGKIVNVCADESVLTDGAIDLGKLRPIIYDGMNHNYNVMGEVVGKAFEDGKQMK